MIDNAVHSCKKRPRSGVLSHRKVRQAAIYFVIAAVAAFVVCIDRSKAADESSKPSEAPLKYRRIYVPANSPETWPRGGEKYLPIDASDFKSWVSALNKGSETEVSSEIDAAVYTGHLEEGGRIAGHGKWDVVTRSERPTLMKIAPPSIVITNLRWNGNENQPVQYGVWGKTAGLPNDWGLLVPASGRIEFDWSVQGRQQSSALEVPWQVPNATSNRVILELPNGQQPKITGATLLESTQVAPAKSNGGPKQRWELAVPPASDAVLQIAGRGSSKNAASEEPSLRETVDYQLQRRGLNIAASWDLDFRGVPQHDLNVPLPSSLELTSVTVDGHAVDWRVDHADSTTGAQAIVSLPKTGDATHHRIELAAWQPLKVDSAWHLPRLQPESVFWSSGVLNVEVSADLELRKISMADCVQQSVSTRADEGEASQLYSYAAYSPSAALEVRLSRHKPDASVRMCSSLALADPDVTGKLATEWNVAQSSLYKFSGELSAGWSIESVETIPSDALAEWFIDRSNQRRTLEIQLTHPAGPGHSITVIVNGRLQHSNLAEPLSADALRIVRWSNARVVQHLVAFQSVEPFVAETIGDLPSVPQNLIGDSERALFDMTANENQVVDLTRASSDAGLRFDVRRAEYTADVQLDANLGSNELRQSWRVTARPTSNPIDRVLVYATAPLGEGARWVERVTNNPIIAKLLPVDDPRRKNLPKTGEVWLLRLSQPTSKLVELAVVTTCPLNKRSQIPLLALPEAVGQHGLVYVHSATGNSPLIDSTGLAPIPVAVSDAKPSADDDSRSVRAAFRYSPGECAEATHPPSLAMAPPAGSGTAPFIIRHLNVESFFWPDGKVQHCATFDLISEGATEFKAWLPGDANLSAVMVNHQLLDTTPLSSAGSVVQIPLSAGLRHASVGIYFETKQAPLGPSTVLKAPDVLHDLPVLELEWNVWLPQEFSARDESQIGLDWRQRLFGPLARSGNTTTFNPLRSTNSKSDVNSDGIAADGHLPSPSQAPKRSVAQAPALELASTDIPQVGGKHADSAIESVGWHKVHHSDLADGVPEPVVVTRTALISSWEIVSLLIAFIVTKACRLRGLRFLVAAALAACLALVLPNAIAPLATGALWGLIVGAIPLPTRTWTAANAHSLSTVARGSVVGSALVVLVMASQSAMAEQDSSVNARTSPGASSVEMVLIPVDADKKPVGSKYFVGEHFLQKLLAPQSDGRGENECWLLRDASCVGELSDTPDAAEVTVGRWSLEYSIETLARDTTISLPLVKNEAEWQGSTMLDGVPVPVVWDSGGDKCTVAIPQPGRYKLTLLCTPKITEIGDRRKISLSVPLVASADVTVHTPTLLKGVNIADASVIPATKEAPRIITGKIAQASRIVIDWPRLKEKSTDSQGLSVTELKMLRVGSQGLELETKYVLEGGSRRPGAVTVKYDPRWIPEDLSEVASSDAAVELDGGLRSLSVPLETGENDRQEASVRWKLDGAPTIGLVRLPPIYLASPQATQRWLALSADSNLECALEDSNTSTATVNEFMSRWGTVAEATKLTTVVANFNADQMWTLATRPRETESTFREILHVAEGARTCRVVYEVNVSPGNAERFRLRLAVPAKLAIDEIRAAEADRELPTRWVRDGEDHVNVMFASRAGSDYRLTLSGTLPSGDSASIPIPRVTASASTSPLQVQLYREDDVAVNLQHFPRTIDSKAVSVEPPPIQWLVRPLGAFRLDDKEVQAARLEVKPSDEKLVGDTFTSITHDGGSWWVTLHARLAASGNLDVARVHFPPSCPGPFEVESSVAETKEVIASNDGGQTVAIRFSSPITKDGVADIRIRSPLTVPPGSSIVVPMVSTVSPLAGHRFIGVPTRLEGEQLSWSEVGVKRADVPKQLAQGTAGPQALYEIVAEPVSVASHPRALKEPAPRVRLVDTSVALGSNDAQTSVSSFVIAPDGIAECVIQLPPDQQLLLAELDGRAALITPAGPSRWRVVLSSTQLPQILDVVSRGTEKSSSVPVREMTRTSLTVGDKSIPVDVSLWTVSQAANSDHIEIVGASPVSAIDQSVLRFDRLVRIAEAASAAAAEAPQPDGANWFRPWAARLKGVHEQSTQLRHRQSATNVARLARSGDDQLGLIDKRFEKWLEESTDLFGNADSAVANLASELSAATGDSEDRHTEYYASQGSGEKLIAQTTRPAAGPQAAKRVAVIVIVLFAGLWLGRIVAVRDFLQRCPYVIGVCAGIAYWAWLSPSWFGLVIAAASAYLALRFTWPGRFIRPEASTVLRSTRTS